MGTTGGDILAEARAKTGADVRRKFTVSGWVVRRKSDRKFLSSDVVAGMEPSFGPMDRYVEVFGDENEALTNMSFMGGNERATQLFEAVPYRAEVTLG